MTTTSPELTARYDLAHSTGLELLKLLCGACITLAGAPIFFYDKTKELFTGWGIKCIFVSWAFVLVSLAFGFLAMLLFAEGRYHDALHRDSNPASDDSRMYQRKSDRFFDAGHWFGIASFVVFAIAIAFVIAAISKLIFKTT